MDSEDELGNCTHYWCFNKVPVYFWLNFKLKREQQIKMYLSCCCLQMRRVKYRKHNVTLLWLQAGNETTQMRLPVNQHHQTAKSKITWNQVCVLARHKLWWFFFISNIYQACMLLWKRFTIFPRNVSCQRSYFQWKLVGLFFCGFQGGNEKFAKVRAGSLSCLTAILRSLCMLVLQFSPMLQREPTPKLGCKRKNTYCISFWSKSSLKDSKRIKKEWATNQIPSTWVVQTWW